MSKIKLQVLGVYVHSGKGGKREVLNTKLKVENAKCKQCGKGDREDGSSRCGDCRKNHVIQKINDQKLQRKIIKQINK